MQVQTLDATPFYPLVAATTIYRPSPRANALQRPVSWPRLLGKPQTELRTPYTHRAGRLEAASTTDTRTHIYPHIHTRTHTYTHIHTHTHTYTRGRIAARLFPGHAHQRQLRPLSQDKRNQEKKTPIHQNMRNDTQVHRCIFPHSAISLSLPFSRKSSWLEPPPRFSLTARSKPGRSSGRGPGPFTARSTRGRSSGRGPRRRPRATQSCSGRRRRRRP